MQDPIDANQNEQQARREAVMFWKLSLGNTSALLRGGDALPQKTQMATADSWNTEPMPTSPHDISILETQWRLSERSMGILRQGHIPEAQEDHWSMYCDNDYIRYFRSWTGNCMFEAHYFRHDINYYVIDSLKINHALAEFGVSTDVSAMLLFLYLITAEVGGDADLAWNEFIHPPVSLLPNESAGIK